MKLFTIFFHKTRSSDKSVVKLEPCGNDRTCTSMARFVAVCVALLGWAGSALALRNGLDLVPPMGWSNWYAGPKATSHHMRIFHARANIGF